MWPSVLRNAAAVILATATVSFGAWSQEWPCVKTSWPLVQTNGSATSYNEDLWEAWKERRNASGQYPITTTTAYVNVYVKTWQTNVFTSNSWTYTNVVAVYTNEPVLLAFNDPFPTNWGKYRVIYPSLLADMGSTEWVEPWGYLPAGASPSINTFALSNGSLPYLCGQNLGVTYPAMVLSSMDTNTRPYAVVWNDPEYNTNGPVPLGAKTIYNGFQNSNGWNTSFNSGVLGLPSEKPVVAFWQPLRTNAPDGSFTIVGTAAGSTSWYSGLSFSTYTQTLAASWATNALDSNIVSVISVTNTGASTGVTMAIWFPTNTTRKLVPLTGSNAQATAFNATQARLQQYTRLRRSAYPWIPLNAIESHTYTGAVVVAGSNDFAAARAAVTFALQSSVTNFATNLVSEVVIGANHYFYTNNFGGEAGTRSYVEGHTHAAYQTDYLETYTYTNAGTNRQTVWVELTINGITVSNSYLDAGDPPGDVSGTNYIWYTWAGLEYTKPGPTIYPRAFLFPHSGGDPWRTVTKVGHKVAFYYAVVGDDVFSFVTSYRVRKAPGWYGSETNQYMRHEAVFDECGWAPQASEFSTNSGTTFSWEVSGMDAIYDYDGYYTRP